MPVVEEGAVDEDAVDETYVARARHSEVEADGAASLDHIRLFDHLAGGDVGLVVDAGDPRVLVDDGLRVAVGPCRAVPLQVVVGEVEAHARVRRERALAGLQGEVPELMAGELDDEHVEAGRVAHSVEHRHADVADRCGAQSPGDQHRGGEARRGRLAVGSRDEHPVGGRAVGTEHLVAHAPGELDVAPQGDARRLRPPDERVVRCEPGRRDDHLGGELDEGGGHLLQRLDDQPRADDGHEPRVFFGCLLGDHEHVGAELGERVGGREPGHREAEHGDPQAAPVGVPAAQGVEVAHVAAHPVVAAHTEASHST